MVSSSMPEVLPLLAHKLTSMKYLLLFCFIATTLPACQSKELPTIMKVTKEEVMIKASHMTTESELQKFQVLAKQIHGLELDLTNTEYLESGTLRRLTCSLSNGEQALATVDADLASLQYRYYGFFMTLEDDTVTYMKAGSF